MPNLHYKCDRCDLNLHTDYLPRVYSLDGERQVTMEQRHFWCGSCDQFSVCESLDIDQSDIDAVQEQLRELRELADTPPEIVASRPTHKEFDRRQAAIWIAKIEAAGRNWVEWRGCRTAPPKCLKCGSPVADVPSTRWQSFTHGGCGGTIQCRMRLSSAGRPDFPHVYDVDGHLVEQGRKTIKMVYAPHYQAVYGPMELFFEPLDHDPYDEWGKSQRGMP
jgi:hypothetical protein